MAFDYTSLAQLTLDQIRDKGGPATLSRTTRTFNPATSTTVDTPSTEAVQALEVSDLRAFYDASGRGGDASVSADTTGRTRDVGFLVAALGVTLEPRAGDGITFGGVAHSIQTVKRVAPNGTALFWRVLARVG